jgi:hypothetical protein
MNEVHVMDADQAWNYKNADVSSKNISLARRFSCVVGG